MNERPTRLVIIGHPVGHSLSPLFQNAALKSAGLNATYDALDVSADALPAVLRELARAGVAGNVTIPHKEAFAQACSRTTEIAQRVGAVNTFWHEKGKLVGDNTDVVGARIAIAALLRATIPHAPVHGTTPVPEPSEIARSDSPLRVTLLGAGGAAAAIIVALESFAPVLLTVAARTPDRAHSLLARLGVDGAVSENTDAAVGNADLVINATPVGLQNDEFPVVIEALNKSARVLDLIAKRGETAWVRECRANGHVAEDGLRMLVEQGAAAFECWFDMVPDRASMWRALNVRSQTLPRVRARPGAAQ